jgi:hypothetical protein
MPALLKRVIQRIRFDGDGTPAPARTVFPFALRVESDALEG